MKKIIYSISFANRQLVKIDEAIDETTTDYLERNYDVSLSQSELEYIKGCAKDQLAVFIKDFSGNTERWNMSYTKIPFAIMAKEPRTIKDLTTLTQPTKEDKFYQEKGVWYMADGTEDFPVSASSTMVREIYKEIYQSAKIAAFYAIESFVAAKKVYPNEFKKQ